ncbi:hypothetical protein ThvES_00019480 [Thiovulum sp. ES]|nr:hypothetical protein ThvES_00019480 [Thiovulum sp. ES]
MHTVICQQIEKDGKGQYLHDGLNFNKTVISIVNKRLGYYNSDELKYDIIVDAFISVVEKGGFKKFMQSDDKDGLEDIPDFEEDEGINKVGKAPIGAWVYMIMDRAVINVSKKNVKYEASKKTINPIEDESDSEAFERVVASSSKSTSSVKSVYDKEYIEELKARNKQLKIMFKRLNEDDDLYDNNYNQWQKRALHIIKTIKSNVHEILKMQGTYKEKKKASSPEVSDFITEESYSSEDDLVFETLKTSFYTLIDKRGTKPLLLKQVFELLFNGFQRKEVSELITHSSVRKLSVLTSELEELLREMASDLELLHDDYALSNILEQGTFKTKRTESLTGNALRRRVFKVLGKDSIVFLNE